MESRLHSAICEGNEPLVSSLVAELANPDARNETGNPPLFLAAERGLWSIVRLLSRAGGNVDLGNFAGVTPLMKASWNGHVEAADVLLELRANVHLRDATGATALYIASEYGHLTIVQRLLQEGAEVDAEDELGAFPLFIAAERGHTEVVKTLMLSGSDIDHMMRFSSLTPINTATWSGQVASVDLLLEGCADLAISNKRGVTPLCNASVMNHAEVLKRLIGAKADLNVRNNNGETAIYIASRSGFVDIVSILIAANANVNLGNDDGSRPLHAAAKNGHDCIAQLLVEAKADVFAANHRNETPLFLACSYLNEQVVQCLLDAMSSRPDMKSEVQETCLELLNSYSDRPSVLRIRSLLLAESVASNPENPMQFSSEDCSQLSQRVSAAGFTAERAQFQAEISHALEDICTRSLNLPYHLTGSYGDGWGNNLTCVNGRTGLDSDIDFTRLMPGLFHIAGFCQCPSETVADGQIGEFVGGHVTCTVSSSVTAETCLASRLRPATDYVFAIRCCCYPEVPVLQPGSRGFLPDALVTDLLEEISSGNPCHLIRAASPGKSGKEMRISTTFLERLFMRSLTTVQGQLFVTVKHLIKNVIGNQVKGLKSYHAKTLIFLMVHQTPAQMWQPERLIELTHQVLDLLVSCLSRETDPQVCMRHFFYPQAPLYFKKYSSSKDEILVCLRSVSDNLSEHLCKFQALLKILNCPDFFFYPFNLLPLQSVTLNLNLQRFSGEYHHLYDCVAQLLLRLKRDADDSTWRLLESLPDCAYTVRECFRAMLQLKAGDHDAARQTLREKFVHNQHRVNRSVKFKEPVFHQLLVSDSAWRFTFQIDAGLQLPFLPDFVRTIFPQKFDTYFEFFYFNFDATVKCLCLELLPNDEVNTDSWFQELQLGADVVELLSLAEFSSDPYQLEVAHEQLVTMSSGYNDSSAAVKEKLVELLRKGSG